jgi:hypothetical protein
VPVRVLLDEQLPRQLGPYLTGHEVRTVQQESRAGLKNGDLLDRAEAAGFAALVTGDQSLEVRSTRPFPSSFGGYYVRQPCRRPED